MARRLEHLSIVRKVTGSNPARGSGFFQKLPTFLRSVLGNSEEFNDNHKHFNINGVIAPTSSTLSSLACGPKFVQKGLYRITIWWQ